MKRERKRERRSEKTPGEKELRWTLFLSWREDGLPLTSLFLSNSLFSWFSLPFFSWSFVDESSVLRLRNRLIIQIILYVHHEAEAEIGADQHPLESTRDSTGHFQSTVCPVDPLLLLRIIILMIIKLIERIRLCLWQRLSFGHESCIRFSRHYFLMNGLWLRCICTWFTRI